MRHLSANNFLLWASLRFPPNSMHTIFLLSSTGQIHVQMVGTSLCFSEVFAVVSNKVLLNMYYSTILFMYDTILRHTASADLHIW